jgi:hypothetical protein
MDFRFRAYLTGNSLSGRRGQHVRKETINSTKGDPGLLFPVCRELESSQKVRRNRLSVACLPVREKSGQKGAFS